MLYDNYKNTVHASQQHKVREVSDFMKKQSETTDKTKQAFIDAFCILHSQMPLNKISVQDITRKAGYNRSTFYQYFFDINDLLLNIEIELMDYIAEKRSKAGTGGHSFIKDLVDLYEEKALYMSALLGDFGSNRFLEQLKAIPEIEIQGLDLPDGHRLKPYLSEYRLSGALSLFRLWLRRGHDLPTEEFISLVADLYQNGIASFDAASYEE